MLAILKDVKRRPDLFHWFGSIQRSQIEAWAQLSSIAVPDDLLEFWSQTGGGDLFESETIFRPTLIPSPEPYFIDGGDVDSANQFRIHNGMSKSYLAFHDGLFLSAVRMSDQMFVTLGESYEETAVFSDFDEWYLRTLRPDYAANYGLPVEEEK